MSHVNEWWRGAVIYQIYPRSFCDANGDGIGDIAGIIKHLDYIAELGVDAVWLSPFFTSPMKDFGYDISDYRDVDPMFGTLADFREMMDKAHALGLKVIIDQVYSHCSDQHEWFKESRSSLDNPKADWFVWADPKPDGTAPNNWLSMFGGPAWQWDTTRQQYYQHNFLASQPDLNFHNREVQDAILDIARFWLDLGVDGFRLDTANYYVHDAQLRDNPPKTEPWQQFIGADPLNPFSRQYHTRQVSQPENLEFLKRLRSLMNQYLGDRFTVGEIGAPEGLKVMAQYTSGGDKLNSAYTFELLRDEHSAEYIRTVQQSIKDHLGDGWPCFSLSNHDMVRSVTRWGHGLDQDAFAKASLSFLLSLRGSACIYQGEELALEEADVAFEDLQDPFGIEFWPKFKGRDGCRVPMIWDETGGFSSNPKPWLPIYPPHLARNPATQQQQPQSSLRFVQNFLRWRKQHPALVTGDIDWLTINPEVLTFIRSQGDEKILVVINLTGQQQQMTLQQTVKDELTGHGLENQFDKATGELILPALGGCYLILGE
ncbi:alpha-glucosidase [Gynuella sunshinyii]|uniref:Glycosidase n=1 Tax=Gynuella sunshinyii YC6258 TaxID=1445510 RepID=A0A0C5VE75_9GAMM|nr:alpha-glucosidase [Gynuella sunshinyii]AJQ92516.1 glycosidase [Gynuella sunshinyii YC6258]